MGSWFRAGILLLCLFVAIPANAADKRYEVIFFGAHVPGTEHLRGEDNSRADLSNDISFKEVDQAGLAALPEVSGSIRMVYEVSAPTRVTGRDAAAEASALAEGQGEPKLYYLFAQLSAAAGQDASFNAFYDSTHLPDVLNVPGMVWGVRGKLVSASPDAKAPGYLALYQFRSFNLRATIDEVNRRLKEQVTRPFPKGVVGPPSFAFYAVPITDR
jgi:hypothetical protein